MISTYAFGMVFHSKSGWKFFQPFSGGIGFSVVQVGTWLCFITSLVFPWLVIDTLGFMSYLNVPKSHDPHDIALDFGSLCLISSVLSLLSLSFAFISLLAFDRHAKARKQKLKQVLDKLYSKLTSQEKHKRKLKHILLRHKEQRSQQKQQQQHEQEQEQEQSEELDASKTGQRCQFMEDSGKFYEIMYNRSKIAITLLREMIVRTFTEFDSQSLRVKLVLGEEEKIMYYLFIILQVLMIVYVNVLAFVIDNHVLKNDFIQTMLLVSFILQLAVILGLTNAVGGRWQHGNFYRSFMLFVLEGGSTFLLSQILAWTSFGLAAVLTCMKLYDLSQLRVREMRYMKFAGLSGLAAQFFLLLSIAMFDKNKMHRSIIDPVERKRKPASKQHALKKSPVESESLKMEINEARVIKIFGETYNYEDIDKFKDDYLSQRRRILDNVAKFKPSTKPSGLVARSPEAVILATGRSRKPSKATLRQRNSKATNPRVKRNRTRSPIRGANRRQSSVDDTAEKGLQEVNAHTEEGDNSNVSDVSEQEMWEEYEDENGNVFYFNVTTGKSYQELPPQASNY